MGRPALEEEEKKVAQVYQCPTRYF